MDKTANVIEHESRAVTRKPRDAAAVRLRLKFANNIHYKLSSQASKSSLQSLFNASSPRNPANNSNSNSADNF